MRSDKAWAFRASNTDLVELDDPSLILEDHLLTLEDHSLILEDHLLTLEDHSLILEDHLLTLEDHSLILEGHLLTLNDPSPIESAMLYTRVQVPFQFNAHAQYALHNIFRYILPIILV